MHEVSGAPSPSHASLSFHRLSVFISVVFHGLWFFPTINKTDQDRTLRSMKPRATPWHISCSTWVAQRHKKIATAVEKFQPNLGATKDLQEHTAASAVLKFIDLSRTPAQGQKSPRFIAGTALIAGSFLVYLAYPVILLYLPFSGSVKFGATVAVWVLSWAVFSAGILLTGPQGYEWVKGLWTRMTGGNSGKRAG